MGGSTCIPLVQRELSALFDNIKPLNKAINGDEVVAYGAAVRAAQLWGNAGVGVDNIRLASAIRAGIISGF